MYTSYVYFVFIRVLRMYNLSPVAMIQGHKTDIVPGTRKKGVSLLCGDTKNRPTQDLSISLQTRHLQCSENGINKQQQQQQQCSSYEYTSTCCTSSSFFYQDYYLLLPHYSSSSSITVCTRKNLDCRERAAVGNDEGNPRLDRCGRVYYCCRCRAVYSLLSYVLPAHS